MAVAAPKFGWGQLRRVFREGALVCKDDFGGEGPLARCIALRTTLYLDGDVVCTIDPRALERADFAELLTRHQAQIGASFSAFHGTVRRYVSWLSRGLGGLGPLTYGGMRSLSDAPTREVEALLRHSLSTMYVEVLNVVLACLMGVIVTQLLRHQLAQGLRDGVGRRSIYRRS